MKERMVVSYVLKNNKENIITKEFNLLTRKKIFATLFSSPASQEGINEEYVLRENIEVLTLKNIIFKKDTRLVIPEGTTLILDSCTFKSGKIDILGGKVKLTNPTLNPCIFSNRIFLSNVDTFDVTINDDTRCSVTILGTSNIFSADIKSRIEKIKMSSKEINLKNIKKIGYFTLKSDLLSLKNCDLELNVDDEQIPSNYLTLENSYLMYDYSNQKTVIDNEETNLKNSKIYIYDTYNPNCEIKTKKLCTVA